jgi:aminopeptidase 2
MEAVEEIEKFFNDKTTKGFDRRLAQSLDEVRVKASWIERDANDVKTWLSQRGFLVEQL